MLRSTQSKYAIFAAACLLGETTGSAMPNARLRRRVEPRPRHQPGRPAGLHVSTAYGINDAGQVVGFSTVGGGVHAAEWSGGSVINLGGLPGVTIALPTPSTTPGRWWDLAYVGGGEYATEWSRGSVINLGGLPGSTIALPTASTTPGRRWEIAISAGATQATEWSGGQRHQPRRPAGSM